MKLTETHFLKERTFCTIMCENLYVYLLEYLCCDLHETAEKNLQSLEMVEIVWYMSAK